MSTKNSLDQEEKDPSELSELSDILESELFKKSKRSKIYISAKWFCFGIVSIFIAIFLTIIFKEELLVFKFHPSQYPKPTRDYWGKSNIPNDKQEGVVYKYNPFDDSDYISNVTKNEQQLSSYKSLWLNHESANPFHHETMIMDGNNIDYNTLSLIEGRGYGINYNDIHKLIKYYNNTFNWNKYKNEIISEMNHYFTKIRGLNIHFIKHTLNKNKKKSEINAIDAIILFHGWPSTFWEFNKILRIFRKEYTDHQIDIIIPSLPGYAFSEYPMHYGGFDTAACGEIFRDLMENILNYSNYIIYATDFGAIVSHNIAYSVVNDDKPSKLRGLLLSMSLSGPALHELLLLSLNFEFIHEYIAAKYNFSVDKLRQIYSPLTKFLYFNWDVTGYQHEHGTRADTIGIALESSPISYLIWIYEKYLSWSDSNSDSNFNQKNRIISGKLTWDDILITNNLYWLTGTITSGIRYYTENLKNAYLFMTQTYIPDIPIGCIHFENDSFNMGPFDKWNYHHLILQKFHEKGGHFPALEVPKVLYDDIIEFINKIEEK